MDGKLRRASQGFTRRARMPVELEAMQTDARRQGRRVTQVQRWETTGVALASR